MHGHTSVDPSRPSPAELTRRRPRDHTTQLPLGLEQAAERLHAAASSVTKGRGLTVLASSVISVFHPSPPPFAALVSKVYTEVLMHRGMSGLSDGLPGVTSWHTMAMHRGTNTQTPF